MRVLGSLMLSMLYGLSACADDLPVPAAPLAFMWQIELPDGDRQALLFYHHRDGGIYTGETATGGTALWRGWWPLHFYAPGWLDDSNLAIRGTFITGVGPDGNRPFDATLRFSYDDGRWQALEPELSEPPFEKPVQLHCGAMEGVEIRNPRALDLLPRYPNDLAVDYTTHRLILLHDPAVSALEPQVMSSGAGYHLVWTGEAPMRASAYARQGTLWIVLPADGKPISMAPGEAMETCDDCRAGVSGQPLLRWIFTPVSRVPESSPEWVPTRRPICRPVGPSGSA